MYLDKYTLTKTFHIFLDPEAPKIINTNMNNSNFLMNFPEKLVLTCYASGLPKPIITWYKVSKIPQILFDHLRNFQNTFRMASNGLKVQPKAEGSPQWIVIAR